MKIEIGTNVVLDGSTELRNLKKGNNGTKLLSVAGAVIYPIGNIIPIIKKGQGCLGLATVKTVTIGEVNTIVEFSVNTSVSKETKDVLYKLYKDNAGGSSVNDDYLSETDQNIPGVFLNNKMPERPERTASFNSVSSRFSSYMDDDEEDRLF